MVYSPPPPLGGLALFWVVVMQQPLEELEQQIPYVNVLVPLNKAIDLGTQTISAGPAVGVKAGTSATGCLQLMYCSQFK